MTTKAKLSKCHFVPIDILKFDRDEVASFVIVKTKQFKPMMDMGSDSLILLSETAVCDLATHDRDYYYGTIYPEHNLTSNISDFIDQAFVYVDDVEVNL